MVPARMPMRIIPQRRAEHVEKLNLLREEYAFCAATDLLTGDFAELSSDTWKLRMMNLGWDLDDLHRLQTEPHRRWANGFSCLAFVVVGAAMAIRLRNSDILTSFFICFLPILVVYYPLLIFGLNSAKEGTLPPCSVWLGNLIMAVWGLGQTRWVLRY
jgi:lipopolysaccharide export system permease protein